jgi:ligand-binding sensor domain-containing protein
VYRFDEGRNGYDLIGGISLYDAHVTGLVIGPDSLVYAVTTEGLFVTEGSAWQKLESLPELAVSLAVAPNDPQTLYAGGTSTGAFRATDGGQTWQPISNGLEIIPGAALRVTALAVDEQDPNRVALATAYGLGSQLARGGVYESIDAGLNWVKLAEADGVVINLILNQGIVYAATANGLARYGEPTAASSVISLPDVSPLLTNPNGIQILILFLTLGLAGLSLIGRREWVAGRGQAAA